MFIIGALTLQEVFLLVLLSFLLNLSHFRIIFFYAESQNSKEGEVFSLVGYTWKREYS